MDKVDKIKSAARRKFLKEIAAVPAVALAAGKSFGVEPPETASVARSCFASVSFSRSRIFRQHAAAASCGSSQIYQWTLTRASSEASGVDEQNGKALLTC